MLERLWPVGVVVAGSLLMACGSEPVEPAERVANGEYSAVIGVGALLRYFPGYGWEPFCTATVYRGNTLLTVEHCGAAAEAATAVAFTTDLDVPRDPFGFWFMPQADIRNNQLQDAREVTEIRIVSHPDDPTFGGSPNTEGIAVMRVDEPYPTNYWWNVLPDAYFGFTQLVGYGMDPSDTNYPQLADDPERILSAGRQRIGEMDAVAVLSPVAGDPPPLLLLDRTTEDEAACHGDSGGPGFQLGAVTSVVSLGFGDCHDDSLTASVLVGEYLDHLQQAAADWNGCLLPTDFNGDGIVDDEDSAIWSENYGCTTCAPRLGDADGDNHVTGSDFLALQRTFGATCPEPLAVDGCLLAADFNDDGVVDISDFSVLASHWNRCADGCGRAEGDATGDGNVSNDDLSILGSEWGRSC